MFTFNLKLVTAPLLAAAMVAIVAIVAMAPSSKAADDATALLRRAERAMGADTVTTLRFTATGTGATFGQAFQPNNKWPKHTYSQFSRSFDYSNAALREEFARSRAEPTGGGAIPLMGTGEQRATVFVHGTTAWNQVGPMAFAPAAAAVDTRIHDLWTSPHGIIKAALKNRAQLTFRGNQALVSFTEAGRFKATATINANYLVERIEATVPNPVLGDTVYVTTFSDYADRSGVQFPNRIVQTHGKVALLDLTVKDVQINAPAGISVPDNVKTATERVTADKVAEGVWFIAGGSHNSVAIEMKDHLILVETPLYDGRSAPVLAEVAKLAPGKPIRFVINSHHHFDHAGGLRTAAAQGATLVTSAAAKPYFDQTFTNPNRIAPDALAKSSKRAKIIGVDGKRVFTDGSRQVEVHFIRDSAHAEGFHMVYLPAEKLLIEADAYTPLPAGAKPPTPANGNNVNLADNISKMGLAVDKILPLHGRVVPMAELLMTVRR